MNNFEIVDRKNGFEIAIIGMLGRFPGAKNVDQFWQNLRDGGGQFPFLLIKIWRLQAYLPLC